MRDDIAWPQRVGDFVHADRRVAAVDYDRRARRLAAFDCETQRLAAIVADGFLMHADFYADADVTIVANRFRRPVGIRKAELEQFSRRVQDSMLSERHETQHASLGLLVNKLSKPEKIHRPRRASIHRGRHTGSKTKGVKIAAVRIHAPIAVDMKVDQTWSDVTAGNVQNCFRVGARQIGLNRRDTIAGDANVKLLIDACRWVKNSTADQK